MSSWNKDVLLVEDQMLIEKQLITINELTEENKKLKQQLAEKDEEIEKLNKKLAEQKTQFELYRAMAIQKGFNNPDVVREITRMARNEILNEIRKKLGDKMYWYAWEEEMKTAKVFDIMNETLDEIREW